MDARLFAMMISIMLFVFVLDLIRRQKMTFKYSLGWLSACGLMVLFTINHKLLFKISALAGFKLPSNFIFFLLLVFSVFFSLLLTLYINEQNNRAERLAQSVGILESKIRELEGKQN